MPRWTRVFRWARYGRGRQRAGGKATYDDMTSKGQYPTNRETLFNYARMGDKTNNAIVTHPGEDIPAHDGANPPHDLRLNPPDRETKMQTATRLPPEERRRLKEEDFAQHGAWVHSKIIEAETVMETRCQKKSPDHMQMWLEQQGFEFAIDHVLTSENLQQLVLYWHLLPQFDQDQIRWAHPIVRVENNSVVGVPSGNNALIVDESGEVKPAIILYAGMFDNHSTAPDVIRKQLTADTYNGGYATLYQRWDQSGLEAQPQFVPDDPNSVAVKVIIDPQNLYNAYTFAHEFTHMRQTLGSDTYALERDLVLNRTAFCIIGGRDGQPVFKSGTGRAGARGYEVLKATIPGVKRLGDLLNFTKVPDPANPGRTQSRKLDLADADRARLQDHIDTLRDFTNSDAGGIPPMDYYNRVWRKIWDVMTNGVANERAPVSPYGSANWIRAYSRLAKLLPTDGRVAGIAATGDIDALAADGTRPGRSILEDFEALVDSAGNDYTPAERNTLKSGFHQLVNTGIRGLEAALKLKQVKIARSVNLQKQSRALFPDLVGKLTSYSNGTFQEAVTATKERLKDAVMKRGTTVEASLPHGGRASLNSLRARWRNETPPLDVTDAAGFGRIPDTDWYQIGATLGFFDIYTQEWDAEANALAVMAPEELIDRYRRVHPNMSKQEIEQVYNQATFICSRGVLDTINPGGRPNVPKYYDDTGNPVVAV